MEGFKHIPVKLGDFSVIDQEFNSIRERFDTEMKKMEDEMTRFRNELMNRESAFFQRSMLTSSRFPAPFFEPLRPSPAQGVFQQPAGVNTTATTSQS